MGDSLGVLGLEMGITVQEVNVRYQLLEQILHSERHNREVMGMTSEETVDTFKLVKNAQQYLRTNIRSLQKFQ